MGACWIGPGEDCGKADVAMVRQSARLTARYVRGPFINVPSLSPQCAGTSPRSHPIPERRILIRIKKEPEYRRLYMRIRAILSLLCISILSTALVYAAAGNT